MHLKSRIRFFTKSKTVKILIPRAKTLEVALSYNDWGNDSKFLKGTLTNIIDDGCVHTESLIAYHKSGKFDFKTYKIHGTTLIDHIFCSQKTRSTAINYFLQHFSKDEAKEKILNNSNDTAILTFFAREKGKLPIKDFFTIAFKNQLTRNTWDLLSEKDKKSLYPDWKSL